MLLPRTGAGFEGREGGRPGSQRVESDARDVLVGQCVHGLLAAPCPGDEPRGPQDAEVLRRERLRDAEPADELVHAPGRVRKLEHDGEPMRCAQGAEQFSCVGQPAGANDRRRRGHRHRKHISVH